MKAGIVIGIIAANFFLNVFANIVAFYLVENRQG